MDATDFQPEPTKPARRPTGEYLPPLIPERLDAVTEADWLRWLVSGQDVGAEVL